MIMHAIYEIKKNREYKQIQSHTTIITQIITWETPTGENPSRRWGCYALSFLEWKWMQVQRSETCGSWVAIVHKSSLFPLSLSIHSQLVCSFMEQNALK